MIRSADGTLTPLRAAVDPGPAALRSGLPAWLATAASDGRIAVPALLSELAQGLFEVGAMAEAFRWLVGRQTLPADVNKRQAWAERLDKTVSEALAGTSQWPSRSMNSAVMAGGQAALMLAQRCAPIPRRHALLLDRCVALREQALSGRTTLVAVPALENSAMSALDSVLARLRILGLIGLIGSHHQISQPSLPGWSEHGLDEKDGQNPLIGQ